MKWLKEIQIALVVVLSCSSAFAQESAPQANEETKELIPFDAPLAKYGDFEIGAGDFFYYQSQMLDRMEGTEEAQRKEIMDQALRGMIFEHAISDLAIEQGYDETEEYQTQYRNMVYNYLSAFYTYHNFTKTFTVTDEELQKIYDEKKETYFQPTKFSFRHIFLQTIDKPDDVKEKALESAQAALALIKAGSDFESVAKIYSDSERKGTVVGPFITRNHKPENAINPQLEDTLLAMKEGEVSDVIETKYGYEILKLETFQPESYTPFSQVKYGLQTSLRNDKLVEWKEALLKEHWESAVKGYNVDLLLDPAADPGAVWVTVNGNALSVGEFHNTEKSVPRRTEGESEEEYKKKFDDAVRQNVVYKYISGDLGKQLCYESIPRYKLLTETQMTKSVFGVWSNKMIEDHVTENPVSDAEKKEFYEENKSYFLQPQQAHVYEMAFKIPPHDKEVMYEVYKAEQETLARAKEAMERVKAGTPFAEVAKEVSESGSAENGGDIGLIGFNEEKLPRSVAREALTLEEGQLCKEPLKDGETYYVVMCHARPEREPIPYGDPDIQKRIDTATVNRKRADFIRNKMDEMVVADNIEILRDDFYALAMNQIEASSLDVPEGVCGGEETSDAGFEPLFDSLDTDGWIIQGMEKAGPKVEDGVIAVGGWDYWAVISKKEFTNFVLKFDVKYDSKGNSGVLFHTPKKEIYKSCFEIQFESGDDPKVNDPKHKSGAIYGHVAPSKDAAKPLGEWNSVEIKYEAPKLWVTINGETVQDGVDISKIEGLQHKLEKGHIAFQRNDFKKTVYFKDVMVKSLD